MHKYLAYLGVGLLGFGPLLVVGVMAQQQPGPPAGPGPGQQITLVYEREVFTYRGGGRRDPFEPLTGENQMGPRFEELSIQGIIYSRVPGRSVALLTGAQDQVHRVRVGDVLGNTRVIEIGPTRVVMAVENFGAIRQEILEMPQRGGADR